MTWLLYGIGVVAAYFWTFSEGQLSYAAGIVAGCFYAAALLSALREGDWL